jgi:uncharacterized protein DUF6916
MPAVLTQKEFSKHIGTSFRVVLTTSQIDLELADVQGYLIKADEQSGMERFSVYFKGPGDVYLPQRVYALKHERMGEFEIFLVPIALNDQGFRYEAVFNYFKNKPVPPTEAGS